MGKVKRDWEENFITEGLLTPELKSFALGLGIGVLTMALFPQVRDKVIPAAENAVKNVKDIMGNLTGITENLKESLEDFAAEAKFEELKHVIDQDIAQQEQNSK